MEKWKRIKRYDGGLGDISLPLGMDKAGRVS
jgi:hypothetical protein